MYLCALICPVIIMPLRKYISLILFLLPFLLQGQGVGVMPNKKKGNTPVDYRFRYNKSYDYNNFKRYFFITAEAGASLLNAENKDYIPSYNGRIGLGYQITPVVGIKGNLGYGNLDGDFSNHTKTLLHADYLEATLNLRIDFSTLCSGYNYNRRFSIFPHLGLGQIQSRAQYLNNNTNVVSYVGYANGTPGTGISKRIVAFTYSMGCEISIMISTNLSFYMDLTTFYADSDRIDGIPILNSSNDWYNTCNFGLNYKLRKQDNDRSFKCQKQRKEKQVLPNSYKKKRR